MSDFRAEFLQRCPAFVQLSAPLRLHLAQLSQWPAVGTYNRFAEIAGLGSDDALPTFAEHTPRAVKAAGGYEQFIARQRSVPTRVGNWHDLFNALVWVHYPKFKWAANALQLAEMGSRERDPRNGRTAVQSRAAQFDEGGVVLLVDDPIHLAAIERLDWHEFFVTNRAAFAQHIRCVVLGHALFEALREPFVGVTAKALPLIWSSERLPRCFDEHRASLDAQVAATLESALRANHFLPLPVLGMPGWHPEQGPDFYANEHYFRRHRVTSVEQPAG